MELTGITVTFEAFRHHRRAIAGVALASLVAGVLRARGAGVSSGEHQSNRNRNRWRELTIDELAEMPTRIAGTVNLQAMPDHADRVPAGVAVS